MKEGGTIGASTPAGRTVSSPVFFGQCPHVRVVVRKKTGQSVYESRALKTQPKSSKAS